MLLSIENACVFEDDDKDLQKAWDMGVRMISLTHSKNSQYGCGNRVNVPGEGEDTGLTERGKAMIGKIEKMGMIYDVSHLSFKSFWDAVEVAQKPFIASHSNSHAVCGHGRNLTDEMFLEIVRRGGLAGICFAPPLSPTPRLSRCRRWQSTSSTSAHWAGKSASAWAATSTAPETCSSEALRTAQNLERGRGAAQRNYSEQTVEDIMWNNARNYLAKMLPEK